VPAPSVAKRILYHGPSQEQFGGLLASLGAASGGPIGGPGEALFAWDGLRCELICRAETSAVLAELERSYVNLLVLDLRCDEACLADKAPHALAILDALNAADDVEERYAFHRIIVLLGGAQTSRSDRLLLELGSRGVSHVLRHVGFEASGGADAVFGARFLAEAAQTLRARRPGKRALCAAGGGITGIFFHLGVMKCLDDCLDQGGVNGFDMYFGISAGAVVSGPLAVGYSVDEYMAAVAGVPGGRMPALDLRLFRLGHMDALGYLRRARLATRMAWSRLRSAATKGRTPSRDQLLFDYADLLPPPFSADGFGGMLERILGAPGATNDFRALRSPLYIGATDQDLRRHVLFGDEEHAEVPISRAIQASLSVNPAFSATEIGGRYYEDGAITRTSNFEEAIRRGATLVFVLDPFLPYVARTPGFNDRRGVLYNIDQDIRTISYTRYETTRNWVLRRHPEVSSYTFVPGNRQRRLLSNNPMDHRPYLEIWRGAYVSTFRRLLHLQHRLEGDLRVHGVELSFERAREVAARLEATVSPRLEDFFPDGKLALRRPPLVGETVRVRSEKPVRSVA
jgi:NTE family protein